MILIAMDHATHLIVDDMAQVAIVFWTHQNIQTSVCKLNLFPGLCWHTIIYIVGFNVHFNEFSFLKF